MQSLPNDTMRCILTRIALDTVEFSTDHISYRNYSDTAFEDEETRNALWAKWLQLLQANNEDMMLQVFRKLVIDKHLHCEICPEVCKSWCLACGSIVRQLTKKLVCFPNTCTLSMSGMTFKNNRVTRYYTLSCESIGKCIISTSTRRVRSVSKKALPTHLPSHKTKILKEICDAMYSANRRMFTGHDVVTLFRKNDPVRLLDAFITRINESPQCNVKIIPTEICSVLDTQFYLQQPHPHVMIVNAMHTPQFFRCEIDTFRWYMWILHTRNHFKKMTQQASWHETSWKQHMNTSVQRITKVVRDSNQWWKIIVSTVAPLT